MAESYNRSSGIPSLRDAVSQTMRTLLGTRAATKGGLTLGSSSAAALKIANTVEYSIDGVAYKVTTEEVAFTDTTVQADGTTAYYVLAYDSSGTGKIFNGTADSGDLPTIPTTHCPVGYAKVVTDGAAFTPGTTLLSAASVTDTYVDLTVMPLSVS